MKSAGKTSPIILEGRYRLRNFIDGGKGELHVRFLDLTTGKECAVTGSVAASEKPLDIRDPSTCPDVATTRRLYQEGITAIQPILPSLQITDIFQRSYAYPLRNIVIDAPSVPEFDLHEVRLENQHQRYHLWLDVKGGHIGKIHVLEIYDDERLLRFKFYGEALNPSFVDSARKYVDPLLVVTQPSPDTVVSLSAEWFFLIHSPLFDSLNGKPDGLDWPSEGDVKLARVAYEEALSSYNCFGETYNWSHSCNDQGGLSLLRRYFQLRPSISFEDFLRRERSAAADIAQKMLFILYPPGTANAPAIRLDTVGRPIWMKKQVDKAGRLLSYRPDYLLNAMALLLEQKSNRQYRLREKSLASLNASLTIHNGNLCFVDTMQNNGEPLCLPKHELNLILFGQSPVYALGINVGDYYLHDENGDGRIQAYEDSVSKKGMVGDVGTPQRVLWASSIQEMLGDSWLTAFHPLPFNSDRFFTEGISLEELGGWVADVNRYRQYRKQYTSDPLQDGAYRVFIFRESTDRFEDYPFWLSRFIALNAFDDVYVVPHQWGMEFALNEVAARDIPLDQLYIGTHGSGTLEREAVFFDRNRRLRFRRGGEVVFTGCGTSETVAMTLGAQLFQYSAGYLVWSDVLNVSLPFGNLLPLAPDGHFFETHFDQGRVVETKTRYVVNPIPGGLF